MRISHIFLGITLILTGPVWGASSNTAAAEEEPMSSSTFAGLELRGIGPAVASRRIVDFAVDPTDSSRYFVAAASGGVWKTVYKSLDGEPMNLVCL